MPMRTLDLEFPLAGQDKRLAAQRQKPFTTPYAVNVQTEGTIEKRMRGGSRPGLVKSFSTRDSNNKVRLLTVMRSLNPEGRIVFTEDLSDFDYGDWENMGQSGMDFPINIVDGQMKVFQRDFMGGVLRNTADKPGEKLNTSASYTVDMWFDLSRITNNTSAVYTTKAQLYMRLADSNPSLAAASVAVEVHQLARGNGGSTYWVWLQLSRNNLVRGQFVNLVNPWSTSPLGPGTLRATMAGDVLTGSWIPDPGSFGASATISRNIGISSNNRVGFGLEMGSVLAGAGYADNFRLSYISSDAGVPPESVMQSTDGNLLRESTAGGLVGVTQNDITLASDRALLAADRLGKLYIADHGNRIGSVDSTEAQQTDGVVDNGSPAALTSDTIDATGDDWTTFGIEANGDWLEIIAIETGSEANIAAALGLHRVAAQVTAGNLILAAGLSIDAEISGITFRVVRGPKVYDSSTDELTIWVPTAGSIPVGCSIIEIFRDRIVLGGDPENPGVWYMSRVSNPNDFNFGASVTDRARAIPGSSFTAEGGGVSLPLSAIAAITEDYCMFSAESELFLLRGDLGAGGVIGNISRQIGIGSRTAWCRVPDGSLVFLCRDGLYRFHPSQPFPQSLSREKLPAELIDVVQNTALTVTLEYDVRFRGVHIFIAPETPGTITHYWFDWETQAFWHVVLGDTDYEPFSLTYDAKANHVLLGCRDGYIRHYDSGAADDDGTAVPKEVDYGPIPLNRGLLAIADSLQITLDDNSDDVAWAFRSGDSPEEAFKASPRAFGTAVAGTNYVQSVRHSGEWGFLRLSTTGAVRWAVEAIELYVLTTPARARKI